MLLNRLVVLTIAWTYGLNFYSHVRSFVAFLLEHPTMRAEAGVRGGLSPGGWAQMWGRDSGGGAMMMMMMMMMM